MPSSSGKQAKAMKAACYGKSTVGIPKKVGCEFARADKGRKFKGNGKKIKLGKSYD